MNQTAGFARDLDRLILLRHGELNYPRPPHPCQQSITSLAPICFKWNVNIFGRGASKVIVRYTTLDVALAGFAPTLATFLPIH